MYEGFIVLCAGLSKQLIRARRVTERRRSITGTDAAAAWDRGILPLFAGRICEWASASRQKGAAVGLLQLAADRGNAVSEALRNQAYQQKSDGGFNKSFHG